MDEILRILARLRVAVGEGAGAESRRPLGLAVVGGLLFSQTLTLYVTPVFYIVMEKLTRRTRGSGGEAEARGPEVQEISVPRREPTAVALRLLDV